MPVQFSALILDSNPNTETNVFDNWIGLSGKGGVFSAVRSRKGPKLLLFVEKKYFKTFEVSAMLMTKLHKTTFSQKLKTCTVQ